MKIVFLSLIVFFGVKTIYEIIGMSILLYQGKPTKPTWTPLYLAICLGIYNAL